MLEKIIINTITQQVLINPTLRHTVPCSFPITLVFINPFPNSILSHLCPEMCIIRCTLNFDKRHEVSR